MKKSILITAFKLIFLCVFAQTNSPYSFFGLGQFNEKAFAFNRMMGMAGSAYSDSGSVNILSPASLSTMKNTALHTGVSFRGSNLAITDKSQQYNDAWIDYFSVGFPVFQNRLGAAIGLMPLSSVNYRIVDSTIHEDIGDVVYNYSGSGKNYRTYINLGLELMPEPLREDFSFSLGGSFSYIFGYSEKQTRTEFNDTSYFLNAREIEGLYLNQLYWNGSAMVKIRLKEENNLKYQLSMSCQFDNGKKMRVKRDVYWDRYINTYLGPDIKDTIKMIEGQNGFLNYPGGIHYGIAYQRINTGPVGKLSEWMLALDYKSRKWSQYSFYGESSNLIDDYLFSIGGYLRPKVKKNIRPKTYYLGFYTGRSMLELYGNEIKRVGMSFGIGIPFRRLPGKAEQTSQLNIGVTLGKEGGKENEMIEESFIQIDLGVLMNSRWFKKRKFN
jgi:hypothetical protein